MLRPPLLLLVTVAYVAGDLCSKAGLNGRTGASTAYPVVCTMHTGDRGIVAGKLDNWYKLVMVTGVCAGKTVFSHGGHLTDCGEVVVQCVTASTLNVREGPSTGSSVVSQVTRGTRVATRGEYAGWTHIVSAAFTRGFVASRYLGPCAPPPSPTPTPPPDTCTSKYDSFKGQCISVSNCTGGTFNGLCKGSAKCCVADTTPATAKSQHLTLAQFNRLFEGISAVRAEALLPYFNEALDTLLEGAASKTARCQRIAAFAAQVGHESAGLLYFEEIASGEDYEGRCSDLGNCEPGDGKRYKGRGPIQLTGRFNYQTAGDSLGLPLEKHPEMVNMPSIGFRTTVWFWQSRGLNRYATGTDADFVTMTRRINGGTNGLADRRSRWAEAKQALSC